MGSALDSLLASLRSYVARCSGVSWDTRSAARHSISVSRCLSLQGSQMPCSPRVALLHPHSGQVPRVDS